MKAAPKRGLLLFGYGNVRIFIGAGLRRLAPLCPPVGPRTPAVRMTIGPMPCGCGLCLDCRPTWVARKLSAQFRQAVSAARRAGTAAQAAEDPPQRHRLGGIRGQTDGGRHEREK